jgi:hypothetical protein
MTMASTRGPTKDEERSMWLVAPIDLDNLVGIRVCDC